MKCADKFPFILFRFVFLVLKTRIICIGLVISCFLVLDGCDRMMTPPNAQLVKDADTKSSQGDYLRAISLYETALDGTTNTAEIHYKLALLYDDKLNDPLNALHHFKRYLALNPNGAQASEVKEFMRRDEIALLTQLSGDSVITRAEAARLRNENLSLRRQIEERVLKSRGPEEKAQSKETRGESPTTNAGGHSYVVRPGDTLFSISRKFYKSPSRWREIRDANKNTVDNSGKLQPGQRLIIP
jgi:tetratricopeptide (TPR) repeat protein